MTFQELKKLKNDIAVKTGLDTAAAARVIGFYNIGPAADPEKLHAMINGDMSPVGPALVALGINGPEKITNKTPDNVHTSGSASAGPVVQDGDNITGCDLLGGPDGLKIAPQRKESTQANKRTTTKEKTITSPTQAPQALQNDLVKAPHDLCKGDVVGDDLEHVQGDILTDNPHELPPGLYDEIVSNIDYYCQNNDIKEPKKMHPHEWKSLCIYIGQSIKARRILQDTTRLKEGGFRYDPQKLLALLNIYDYTCGQYKQVPFEHNFARFAGVSLDYLKDYMKRGLTSSHVGLAEKAHDIQRAGLIDGAAGGGSASVPLIFLCKSLGELSETVTIQHVTTESTQIIDTVPDLSRAGLPGPV